MFITRVAWNGLEFPERDNFSGLDVWLAVDQHIIHGVGGRAAEEIEPMLESKY